MRPDGTLWTLERGDLTVHLFGGGPATTPWSCSEIETLVRAADQFWNEVPEITPESVPLIARFGIDRATPLRDWLNDAEMSRVERAADGVGVSAAQIAPLRPWLASQVLKNASEVRAGLRPEDNAETRLTTVARDAGVQTLSEFSGPEELFSTFAGWPREVERQRLFSTVAEVECGDAWLRAHADACTRGDLAYAEAYDTHMRSAYSELYEYMVRRRNHAWIERIAGMRPGSIFIVVGLGHTVGPDGIPALARRVGFAVTTPPR